MRLPKHLSALAVAGLFAGAIAGVPAATAAQNFSPNCQSTAGVTGADYTDLAYQLVCTTYSSSAVVNTGGDNNQGEWTAKAYDEGAYVHYTNGNWYRAALAATASDEPSKPQKDTSGNDLIVWTKLTSDTAAAWSSTSTAATTTAGKFPADYVVKKTVSSVVKYFKANAETAGSDDPASGGKWTELSSGDLSCIAYYVTDGKPDWSATGGSSGNGVYPSQGVVRQASDGKYYAADSSTTAADEPGTSSKWHEVTSSTCTRNGSGWTLKPGTDVAFTGPQPGGSKTVSVTYSGDVNGYSVIALNRLVLGVDSEPPVLDGATGGPALNQTQFCVAELPSSGFACSLQSKVDIYGKVASNTYKKLTGSTIAVKNSDSTYTDLADTTFYADRGLAKTADGDFLKLGPLGAPTNSGAKIFPALAGNSIEGALSVDRNACVWGGAPRLVVTVADAEGQVAHPVDVQIESKYFTLDWSKGFKAGPTEKYIARGCRFRNLNGTKVYYRDAGGVVKQVSRAPQGAAGRVIVADGSPAEGYGTLG